MDKWESIAERKIREAIEAGKFDNLPSKGKPIELDIDPDPEPVDGASFAPREWLRACMDRGIQGNRCSDPPLSRGSSENAPDLRSD
ncbi:MAG TPA: DnaJ family domain-containing protein [Bryobacteraceae bacterium]|nr:DnaJ family domain-containing protein [Bryobacteraceae bacterium]